MTCYNDCKNKDKYIRIEGCSFSGDSISVTWSADDSGHGAVTIGFTCDAVYDVDDPNGGTHQYTCASCGTASITMPSTEIAGGGSTLMSSSMGNPDGTNLREYNNCKWNISGGNSGWKLDIDSSCN